MIKRYTYERLTCFVGNTAVKSAVTKGVGALVAIGGIEVLTTITSTITKNLEVESLVRNTMPLIDKMENLKEQQDTLRRLINSTVAIAERPTPGIVTRAMQTESTQHMITEGNKTVGKIFNMFSLGR